MLTSLAYTRAGYSGRLSGHHAKVAKDELYSRSRVAQLNMNACLTCEEIDRLMIERPTGIPYLV